MKPQLLRSSRFLLLIVLATPAAALDKQQAYGEMLQIAGLGTEARSALMARYRELSEALGGDDPGRLLHHARVHGTHAARAASLESAPPPGCMVAGRTLGNNVPVTIPLEPAVVTSTIEVVGLRGAIFDVDVRTFIRHTFNSDLDITLTSPEGTVVTLTTDNGGASNDVFNGTLWDDQADTPHHRSHHHTSSYTQLHRAEQLGRDHRAGSSHRKPARGTDLAGAQGEPIDADLHD